MIIKTIAAALVATACTVAPAGTPSPASLPVNDAAVYVGNVRDTQANNWTPRSHVRTAARSAGYSRAEWRCLEEIIDRESDWNPKAANPNSTAYGLFQQLRLNPNAKVSKQTRLGLRYIASRYGSACAALQFHDKNGWY